MEQVYVIGEIGQNHNGSMDLAHRLIDAACVSRFGELMGRPFQPMNAIKLTKRDLAQELTASEMNRPYNSPNSFGETYGKHREVLELTDNQHFELYQYAKSEGLDFVDTLCAPGCLSLLDLFEPDRLKVASRDLTNLPLLKALAETKIPLILSTGMGGIRELEAALEVITPYHENITILHCLSEYPAKPENLNLRTIPYLKKRYPQYTIGYSDHSIGILAPAVAVALGAEVIEKHITIDRGLKGTDQKGSLAPEGIYRMMRNIRNVEKQLGKETMFASEAVRATREKLERSIASKKAISKGKTIREDDVHLLSPGTGYRWNERQKVIGKKATVTIEQDELITHDKIE